MENKKYVIVVAGLIIIVGAFFGGMKYGQSKKSITTQDLQNLSSDQRQQLFQQTRGAGNSTGGRRGAGANGQNGNFVNGDIIGKDDKSITVSLNGNGSKIVFFSDTTKIGKIVDGTTADLEVGKQVMVEGTKNSDGSLTAQSIQLRPTTATPSK